MNKCFLEERRIGAALYLKLPSQIVRIPAIVPNADINDLTIGNSTEYRKMNYQRNSDIFKICRLA